MLDYQPVPDGRSFSLRLDRLPQLQPQLEARHLKFTYQKQTFELDVVADRTLSQVMDHYPFVHEVQYLQAPLSRTLETSLLPQLRKLLIGKSPRESVEFLVALTRSAFKYKEDKEHFGRSKPMIPDELFHYAFSDCEDRSALFFNLVKELLHIPMLVVAYPDHLTIALALEDVKGNPIQYQGRTYYICDPTGPSNSHRIGWIPNEYRKQSYEIIDQYL